MLRCVVAYCAACGCNWHVLWCHDRTCALSLVGMVAITPISAGAELFSLYGAEYWLGRIRKSEAVRRKKDEL